MNEIMPKPGEYVWLVPLRYWETGENFPTKLLALEVSKNIDRATFVYGYSFRAKHEVYIPLRDYRFAFSYASARSLQLALADVLRSVLKSEADAISNRVHATYRSTARFDVYAQCSVCVGALVVTEKIAGVYIGTCSKCELEHEYDNGSFGLKVEWVNEDE